MRRMRVILKAGAVLPRYKLVRFIISQDQSINILISCAISHVSSETKLIRIQITLEDR